jgi:hypothetical protein
VAAAAAAAAVLLNRAVCVLLAASERDYVSGKAGPSLGPSGI